MSTEGSIDFYPDIVFSYSFRFWLFLISNILSIFCCFFVLYYLLFDRVLRQTLNNHVIIILLFICLLYELIDIPFILNFFHYGFNWKFSVSFSVFWSFLDYALYGTQFIIFSWSTIERHILIFHHRWLLNRKRRFFIHYLPLIILILYSFIYYCIIIFAPFCPYIFYRLPAYGVPFPCIYYYVNIIAIWELVCHQIIPIFIIIIFSLTLLIRVLCQKAHLHRSIQWRKQRKMTIQLLSVSILYIVFSAPGVFLNIFYAFGISRTVGAEFMSYAYFFSYYIVFLFPFVCLGTLPELKKKLEKFFCYQRQGRRITSDALPRNRITRN
ncbi:unnamed protein product [Rotaria sordida]|uniref:G-protein coupled receptors family 1 profile domain-containing protein n=1 Tax=Rotaria sordida TaxID=392033 RepID=A0A814GEU1_9BILA|nr:unnamed protein product [Rotaria sordida]CAF3844303.1 unnamed protein product [Rotaria sordida]